MIRRSPTLIPMSDLDVQDIRDMVAKQKATVLSQQQLVIKMKKLAENPTMVQDDYNMMAIVTRAQEEKEKAEKARRLGLDGEPSRS